MSLLKTLGINEIKPGFIFALLVILVIGMIVIKVITSFEGRALKKSVIDETSHIVIIRVTKIILWILLILTIITKAGIDPTPYVAVLASCGVAVALALRDSLSNVAGGIILMFTKPFKKGDEIEIGGISGVVDFIDIMTTKLHTFSNQVITVPNSKMVNSVLINRTANGLVRVDLKFMVSYDSDLEKVRVLLNNVVKDGELLLEDPNPIIGVCAHEDSGVKWDMMVWTKTEDRFNAKYYLEEEIKKEFDKNDIRIPFPRFDVSIEGENVDK